VAESFLTFNSVKERYKRIYFNYVCASYMDLMNKPAENTVIHLVSFNIPYPPDYGGVMDVFYKITALKQVGAGIILHCFTYGRSRSRTLEKECLRVYYYRRDLNLFHMLRKDPFIVISRRSDLLLQHLLSDTNPILFEGLHTTSLLGHPALDGRLKMVRTHNIEHLYYRNLAANEKNPFRRLFYTTEAKKLERYEGILARASLLLTISPGDTEYFHSKYNNAIFVGPFHPVNECSASDGKGNYVLLHGDFSTAENNAAAHYILSEIAPRWKHRTILAGKRPSDELLRIASRMRHVKVVANPSQSQMDELISNAQVCLLNASQPTGMKLKLINALCSGRHIVASEPVVAGTSLENLCNVAHSTDEWINLTDNLMQQDFTPLMRSERDLALRRVADNTANAERIVKSVHNYGGPLWP
jgi:hypothetical protein